MKNIGLAGQLSLASWPAGRLGERLGRSREAPEVRRCCRCVVGGADLPARVLSYFKISPEVRGRRGRVRAMNIYRADIHVYI